MAWSLLCDDPFTHADTAVGLAGTTTGVPTPSTGREWTEVQGSVWNVVSNQAKGTPEGVIGTGYLRDFLRRPARESRVDARIIADYPTAMKTDGFPGLGLRQQAGGDYYLAHLDFANAKTYVYKVVSGTPTAIVNGDAWTGPYDNTHTCSLEFSALGTGTTRLAYIVTDTTTSTVVNSGAATDTAASLQAAGYFLLVCWANSAGSVFYERVRTYEIGLDWYAPNAYEQQFIDN